MKLIKSSFFQRMVHTAMDQTLKDHPGVENESSLAPRSLEASSVDVIIELGAFRALGCEIGQLITGN